MKFFLTYLVTFGVLVSTISSEEPKPIGDSKVEEKLPDAQTVEEENAEGSHREGKLFKGDSVVVQKPFFTWPFTHSDKAQPNPQVEEMQGRFFSVVKSTGTITPLEMLIDTLKRVIPECIEDLDRVVENYQRFVQNNEGVPDFEPFIFTQRFSDITQRVNGILANAVATVNGMAAPTPAASMAFF